jgi:hypothetical protein
MDVSGQLHVPAAFPPGKEPLVEIQFYNHSLISNAGLQLQDDMNRASESIIKTSVKESLGHYNLKKNKPWFMKNI